MVPRLSGNYNTKDLLNLEKELSTLSWMMNPAIKKADFASTKMENMRMVLKPSSRMDYMYYDQ